VKRAIAGLYAITPDEPDTDVLLDKVAQALRGGAAVVQYRNKTAGVDLRRKQGHALAALCREAEAHFIVNDDLALALEVDADGAHLGGEDGDLAVAAVQAKVDYLAFGSVFDSVTKPAAVRAPLAIFAEARRRFSLPLVAIGGITLQNAPQVFGAGADAVAVISALFDAGDIAACAAGFARLYQQQGMQQ